ncbi:hypothetical protein [Nocardia sp. NPDC051832]|uniref:hypothetical protein n=1 Tax=Nocardia sp. NPDC051832 TaxID=3155673 RepID=UPI0034280850
MAGGVGCFSQASETEQARFTKVPEDCSVLIQPTEKELKEYAPSSLTEREGFSHVDMSELPDSVRKRTLMCSANFTDPVLPIGSGVGGNPRSRSVSVTLKVFADPMNAVSTAINSVQTIRSQFSGNAEDLSVGDRGFIGIGNDSGRVVRANAYFQISNLIVDVIASGENFSGISDTSSTGSPQLISEVTEAAESVARAVANNVEVIVPSK